MSNHVKYQVVVLKAAASAYFEMIMTDGLNYMVNISVKWVVRIMADMVANVLILMSQWQ